MIKRSKKSKHRMVMPTYIILILAVGFYRLVEWARLSFSDLTLEQIIFHIKVPLDGADTSLVQSAIRYILVPMSLLLVIIVIVHLLFVFVNKKREFHYYILINISIFKDRFKEIKLRMLSYRIVRRSILMSSLLILLIAFMRADRSFNVLAFVRAQTEQSTFIEENYVEPLGSVEFPEKKKNLIYIYLESVENTYSSKQIGGAFDDNYIEELSVLAEENISFSHNDTLGGFKQAPGAGWTMGAMFAQSTGLPLSIPIDGNSMSEYSSFFPGVVSLGDVLQKFGYSNHLLIGSDATFGGRRKFFEQHGNYNIYDYNYAVENKEIPEDYYVFWGYEDHKLLEIAKEKLLKIKDQPEPFNFTMLTVDTHFEDGYLCDLCENKFDDQYANVIACSSKMVFDFVDWIQQQDFYENTSIVIVGDHLTMDSDFLENIDPDYQRTIYNAFINSGFDKEDVNNQNRNFNTYDIFPTVLATLNVDIKGNRLGLGTNLFSDEKTLIEKHGNKMNTELSKNSKFYRERFIYGDISEMIVVD